MKRYEVDGVYYTHQMDIILKQIGVTKLLTFVCCWHYNLIHSHSLV
jgi:hypothetical protein